MKHADINMMGIFSGMSKLCPHLIPPNSVVFGKSDLFFQEIYPYKPDYKIMQTSYYIIYYIVNIFFQYSEILRIYCLYSAKPGAAQCCFLIQKWH